jgi:poly-gamma-glutamate synthesis protein (capsule biosynthesis protein)
MWGRLGYLIAWTGAVLSAVLTGASARDGAPPERITLVFAGDTGTNGSGAPASAEGGYKAGRRMAIAPAFQAIRPRLKGDIVFANLESVVTEDNTLPPRDKMFVFRMHPDGLRAVMAAGVNLVSTANNHAMDFGARGAGDTLRHVEAMAGEGLLGWPGLARTREAALAPQVFSVKGMSVAVSAFGIGGSGFPVRDGEAGSLRGDDDFAALVSRLGQAKADLKILSVHYGQEFAPQATETEIRRLRQAAALPGLAIIAGHHAHVARGVELSGNHLIFYGLGNFMHFGTQNMARFDLCRDFGLLVRVGLLRMDGVWKLETVEAVPLTGMHVATRPMTGDAARMRLAVLNHLGARLDNAKEDAHGLRFAAEADGSGLWCAKDASDARCADWREPPLPSGAAGEEIARACARDVRRGG